MAGQEITVELVALIYEGLYAACCVGAVYLIVIANIEYRRFLKSLSPEELAAFKVKENAEMQTW